MTSFKDVTLKVWTARRFFLNVLLTKCTNFQHTSTLKCSLKLKLHQLKVYKPLYHSSLTVRQPLLLPWTSLCALVMIQNTWATAILSWEEDNSHYQLLNCQTCTSRIPCKLYTAAPVLVSTTLLQCNKFTSPMADASYAACLWQQMIYEQEKTVRFECGVDVREMHTSNTVKLSNAVCLPSNFMTWKKIKLLFFSI